MKHFLVALVLVFAAGCQHQRSVPDRLADKTVAHIVLVWMKDPADAASKSRIIEYSQHLREIPGVLSVTTGSAVPSTRPIVDSTFSLGLVIILKDRAALDAYLPHPIHQQAVKEVFQPLVSRIQVYDVEAARE